MTFVGDGNAGRNVPLGDSGAAHHALRHHWKRLVPFELRNVERTTDHAIPATDTVVRIVDNRSIVRFLERPRQAGRDAGRILAMEALLFGETPDFLAGVVLDLAFPHDGPVFVRQGRLFAVGGRPAFDPLIVIVHLARDRTTAAADALRQVN